MDAPLRDDRISSATLLRLSASIQSLQRTWLRRVRVPSDGHDSRLSPSRVRRLSASGVVLLYIVTFVVLILRWRSTSAGVSDVKIEEQHRLAIQLYSEDVTSLGNTALALVGVLWAFVIYKESRVVVRDWASHVLFWLTTLTLVTSYVLYVLGHAFIVKMLFQYNTISLTAPRVTFFKDFQVAFLAEGILSMGATIFMCRQRS